MLIPRRIQLQQANDLQCFHLWSPVMPGLAALAGNDLKNWVAKLLKRLAGAYAVRLQGFSIESDQFHLILQWVPGQAAQWSEDELWRRWVAAHPAAVQPADAGQGVRLMPGGARQRLASLSAFLQQFKQLITFRFNRETKHKGTIWKGRFRMAALKDASALAGALAFIDLLPVAKENGARPEESPFSSLHARVATYKAAYGKPPYGPLAEPDGEWKPFDAEIARELREGDDPLAAWLVEAPVMPAAPVEPPPAMPDPAMPPVPGMPEIPPMMPGMADPGMPPPPPDTMGGTDPMAVPPMTMPATPMPAAPSDGSWPGEPDPPRFGWLLALREDSPLTNQAPKGLLAFLPLRKYLQLLDTLVARAKAWPHLPASAPGRAPAPQTPAWDGGITQALAALGLDARGFEAQWQRLAKLRV